jgi:Spy/CpxP family protein refolding chaperone
MKKRIVAAVGVAVIGLCFATVQARPRFGMSGGPMMGGGPFGGPEMMLPMLLHSANLTSDQEARVRAMMDADRPTVRSLFADLRGTQNALIDKLFAPGDLAAPDLKPELDRLGQARQRLIEHAATTAVEVRKILTPDQLARTAEVRKKMQALHSEMRDLMGGDE